MFPLSSNISSFSFNKREHLFDWGLHALIGFFTAHVTFVLDFPTFKFQYSTDSFVFTFTDVEWSFMVCASFFKCVFTNSFIIFGVGNSFCQTLLLLYTGCFLERNFRLRGRGSCWYNYIFERPGLLVYLIFFCYVY